MPDGMSRVGVPVTTRSCEQTAREVEFEQDVRGVGLGHADLRTFVYELLRKPVANLALLDDVGPACEVEGVLVVLAREGVHRKAAIPKKVLLLGRRDDESKQALSSDQGAHRVEPRPTVAPDRCQERKPNSVLIEQLASGRSKIRSFSAEFAECDHAGTVPNLNLAPTNYLAVADERTSRIVITLI